MKIGYDVGMIDAITGSSRRFLDPRPHSVEHVQRADTMRRLLAFTGHTIDDVVNSPIARAHVMSFFQIGEQMKRITDVQSLEQQWNPSRRR